MCDKRQTEYSILAEKVAARGVDIGQVKASLKAQVIETPSWGYSDAGTRFGTVRQPGAAVTLEEKIADAAQAHKFTGVAPLVAVHVLWDFPNGIADCDKVAKFAESQGVKIGAINPNVFQDPDYTFGSITNEKPEIRDKALNHILDSVAIGKKLGSEIISLWLAATNYPGESDFRRRKTYAQDCLMQVHDNLPAGMRMLIEYKPFEPASYHTDFGDWGMSYVFANKCGPKAQVLVDLGHHLQGQNIEHIVAFLIDEKRLGGFHFNNHKYADDDLTTGSVNPYEVFLIYNELVKNELEPTGNPEVSYVIDQAHITKSKIEAAIQTIMHLQMSYAKALTVDRKKLLKAQLANDVISAEMVLQDAFNTDVQPLLAAVREEMGLDPNPLEAFRASGYAAKVIAERGLRSGSGGLGA